ncbi:MAG: ribonuclease III [Anaerolineales bacterium]|nr:ribonuclease III [Anaerolineales bacterium]
MTERSKRRDVESAAQLNERLNLSFSNLALLTAALTHRSYVNEHRGEAEDNERLEYLGDAALDLVVGEWAYRHFPEAPEGDLTKIRAHLVRNENLAKFAQTIGLGGALRLGRGEKMAGGNRRERALGSTFEALLGAIYLDAGLQKVKDFLLPFVNPVLDSILEEINDPKSQLQERAQAEKMGTLIYRVVAASGPDHARVYDVEAEINGKIVGRGSGSSKSAAERESARDALKNL